MLELQDSFLQHAQTLDIFFGNIFLFLPIGSISFQISCFLLIIFHGCLSSFFRDYFLFFRRMIIERNFFILISMVICVLLPIGYFVVGTLILKFSMLNFASFSVYIVLKIRIPFV